MVAKSFRGIAILVVASLLLPPGALRAEEGGDKKTEKKTTPGKGMNFYSPEREMRLGERLSQQADSTIRLLQDPLVLNYVRDLAERVARTSDVGMPIHVRVVDSNEVGAFSLPGGHFYVNAGLILEAETEAELAGVISHEVAHIAARHATRQMSKAQLMNWMSIPLFLFGGPVAVALQNGATLAVPLTYLKFSRDAEREADRLGLQYHYASGYDPMAFVHFFERTKRMERDKVGGIAVAFSSHPMTRDRIAAAEALIDEQLPARDEYVIDTSRYTEVRSYLQRLMGARQNESGAPMLRKRTDKQKNPF